jgi:hypothetical protein
LQRAHGRGSGLLAARIDLNRVRIELSPADHRVPDDGCGAAAHWGKCGRQACKTKAAQRRVAWKFYPSSNDAPAHIARPRQRNFFSTAGRASGKTLAEVVLAVSFVLFAYSASYSPPKGNRG